MMPSHRTTRPLRFTPYAWAKLLRLRDLGDTEVGGFGVSALADLLLIEDVCLVRQRCSAVSVKFEDEAVADYIDRQVDLGLRIEQFARIWIHTHPGHSASPSNTDEETFERCFGSPDWAVMFILARGGQTYARLRFSSGPGGAVILPVEIDFGQPFAPSDWASWDAEFARSVAPEVSEVSHGRSPLRSLAASDVARDLALDRSVLDGAMLLDERALGEWWDEDLFRTDPFTDNQRLDPFWEMDDAYDDATLRAAGGPRAA